MILGGEDYQARSHRGALGWYVVFQINGRVLETAYHRREEGAWEEMARRIAAERRHSGHGNGEGKG